MLWRPVCSGKFLPIKRDDDDDDDVMAIFRMLRLPLLGSEDHCLQVLEYRSTL